ncbi:MAG: transposase [Cytophagales bacterium]
MGHTIYQVEYRKYTLEFKHQVCKEHIEQGLSLSEIVRKYELSSHSLIHDWLRRLGYVAPTYRQFSRRLYISEVKDTVMAKQTPVKLQENTSEVDRLKRELEDAKIQLEGYKRMIEIAEDELKIPIRKKYDTK